MIPYNHLCPKRGLIHQDRDGSIIRPRVDLQGKHININCQALIIKEKIEITLLGKTKNL